MRSLSIDEDDIRYVYTFGTRFYGKSRVWILLRDLDIHPDAQKLSHVARRAGILLEQDRQGVIRSVRRDRSACRKLRSQGMDIAPRSRHSRIG